MRGRPPIFRQARRQRRAARGYRRRQKRLRPSPGRCANNSTERSGSGRTSRRHAEGLCSERLRGKLYGVLYVDPPWDFLERRRTTGRDRHAASHYRVMSLDEQAALKLPVASNRAHLCTSGHRSRIWHEAIDPLRS